MVTIRLHYYVCVTYWGAKDSLAFQKAEQDHHKEEMYQMNSCVLITLFFDGHLNILFFKAFNKITNT